MTTGAASSVAARAASNEACRSELDGLLGRLVQRRVDRGADLIGLLGHPADGGDHDDGHQGEQAEDDQAGGQAWA